MSYFSHVRLKSVDFLPDFSFHFYFIDLCDDENIAEDAPMITMGDCGAQHNANRPLSMITQSSP
jgi:hypothetical protein